MDKNKELSSAKNIISGAVLIIYLIGFLILAPSFLELHIQKTANPVSSEAYFFYYVFAIVLFLSTLTIVIKKLILNESIEINFWTFTPVIYFGIIYLYLFIKTL